MLPPEKSFRKTVFAICKFSLDGLHYFQPEKSIIFPGGFAICRKQEKVVLG